MTKKLLQICLLLTLALVTIPSTTFAKEIKLLPAKVSSIVEGDIFQVIIAGRGEQIRLIGIDVPEAKYLGKINYYGIEAYDYLVENIVNKIVYLEFDTEKTDRYGRLLVYVWLEEPINNSERERRNKMLNAKLLLDGYAKALPIQPNVRYSTNFSFYQEEAKEKHLKIWE